MGRTCKDIRKAAFNSHPGCYLNPSSAAPGICQLRCIDAIKIFVLVNFEGGALFSAPIETLTQMWHVIVGCFSEGLEGCTRGVLTTVIVSLGASRLPFPLNALLIAGQVADFISTELGWESNGFRWFPLGGDDNDNDMDNRRKRQITPDDGESPNNLTIRIILVDTKDLNISNGTMSQPLSGPTLGQAVETFSEAISGGMLSRIPIVLNDTETVTGILSAGECSDTICNSTNITELATAPPPTTAPTGGAKIIHLHYLAFLYIALAVFCMGGFDAFSLLDIA